MFLNKILVKSVKNHFETLDRVEHMSDIARLEILMEVGGIYVDDDLLFLKVKTWFWHCHKIKNVN